MRPEFNRKLGSRETDGPRWIPVEGSLVSPESLPEGRAHSNTLVAGFSTAMPRLADIDLAPRVARLVEGNGHRPAEEGRRGTPDSVSLADNLLLLSQVHSADILHAGTPGQTEGMSSNGDPRPRFTREGKSVHRYDGATATPGQSRWLGVKTADCVPLLAVAGHEEAYGALHVGWRGAAAGIVEGMLARWGAQGLPGKNVRMVLGPHIGACCYEVGQDCLDAFAPADLANAVIPTHGRTHLDLATVIQNQVRRHGVNPGHVVNMPWCTRCHSPGIGEPAFASHRASLARGETLSTTNVAIIGYR